MQHNQSVTNRPVRIPAMVWFLGLGLAIAIVAIFLFNVSVTTVGTYALIAFFIGSHFFVHGWEAHLAGMAARPSPLRLRRMWTARLARFRPNLKTSTPAIPAAATKPSHAKGKTGWTKTATLTRLRKRPPRTNGETPPQPCWR